MNNINSKLKQLVIAILVTQGVAFTATAADVPISPVITGSVGASGNAASNVWFTLDDSGSMGSLGTGKYSDGTQRAGRLVYGYVPYNPNTPYENYIPVDHLGNKLPLPNDLNKTYKLGPHQGTSSGSEGGAIGYNSLYNDIFITYARDKMGFVPGNLSNVSRTSTSNYVPYADNTPATVADHETIDISKTALIPTENNASNYISNVADDTTCDLVSAAYKIRCQVWKTYYSTRMLTVKSGLSLALYKHRDLDYRFGFQSMWVQGDAWTFDSNWNNINAPKRAGSRWGIWGQRDDQLDKRIATFPLKANNATSRQELYKWLFTLIPESGTPTRGVISHLFHQLKLPENGGSSTGAIYREDPMQPYNETSNPAKTCRRNHNIVLTDGQWETPYAFAQNEAVQYKLNGYSGGNTESTFALPGNLGSYSPQTAYRAIQPLGGRNDTNPGSTAPIHLADIAFTGWITDLDGDSSNNNVGDNGAVIIKDPTIIDSSGSSQVVTDNWSHFKDPATWQHINTHTIGLGLNTTYYEDLFVNPPKSEAEALKLKNNYWGLEKIISRGQSWERGDWTTQRASFLDAVYVPNYLAIGDLARAAITGRGLFYDARSGGDVVQAFDEILASIKEDTEVVPAKTGSSGVAGNSKNAGNSYFSSRYDAAVFNGELMKYKLFDGSSSNTIACFGSVLSPLPVAGTACSTPAWNVGKTLSSITWDSRDVITAKVDGTSHSIVDFDEDAISATQKATLKDNFPVVLSSNFADDEARYEKLFNYVKGDSEQEASGIFRSRDGYEFVDGSTGRNIFGAIVRSSPVFAGLPTAFTSHLDKSKIAYKKYVQFLSDYKTANMGGVSEVIYVAANDGMLHAISANSGDVKFSYVPNAVYEHLPNTVVPDQQVSLNDGNIDVQLVNFGSDVTDDNNNKDWQRVLVGSMGGGAKGLYALNVTDPSAIKIKTATKGNWEFSDDDMGNIMAQPAIIQLQDNTWAAVVGNGYNSKNNKAALFVINLETGELIQKLEMPSSFSDSSKPNGLGPLFFAAYPDKGVNKRNYYDRAYAGDLQGNLWVFDLTKVKNNTDATDKISVVHNKPLFTADHTDSTGVTAKQPITVAPKVVKHPMGYGYLVHFGTGALFERNDLSSGITNSVYGIWDDWVAKEHGGLPETTLLPSDTVTNTELNPIKLKTATITVEGNDVDLRYLDNSNINTSWKLPGKGGVHRGWRVDLLKGERAWQPAQTAYGSGNSEVMSYNTVRYVDKTSQSDCVDDGSGVTSWQLVFNPEDFARNLSAQGALDINKDGKYDKGDVLNADDTPRLSEVDSLGNVKTIIPIGEITVDSINYNSSDQDIEQSGVTQSGCRLNRQTKSNSSSGTTGVTVQRCAYFSSWKELK